MDKSTNKTDISKYVEKATEMSIQPSNFNFMVNYNPKAHKKATVTLSKIVDQVLDKNVRSLDAPIVIFSALFIRIFSIIELVIKMGQDQRVREFQEKQGRLPF